MRARSALFTLFGDVVRPAGGEAWLSALTTCMGALGFSAEATRTALHRMATEGWVEPRREGRYAAYRLTDRGLDRLEEAAARIYRLRAADWDGCWRLLVAPDARRDTEVARALRWMGFGQLSADTWISPHNHGDRLDRVLDEHSHTPLAQFVTDLGDSAPARDRRIVATAWDLDRLREAHAGFIRDWEPVTAPDDPMAAFMTRIELVHHWRSFLFLDPGLPPSLLPDDWLGKQAAHCFWGLRETLEAASWAYWDLVVAGAPATATGEGTFGERDPDASPFARGLTALGAAPHPPTQADQAAPRSRTQADGAAPRAAPR